MKSKVIMNKETIAERRERKRNYRKQYRRNNAERLRISNALYYKKNIAYFRKWYAKNRTRVAKYRRKYYIKNNDKIRKYRRNNAKHLKIYNALYLKKWRVENPLKINEYRKKYAAKNKSWRRKYMKRYRKDNAKRLKIYNAQYLKEYYKKTKREQRWLLHLRSIRHRCGYWKWYELVKNFLSESDIKYLWFRDKAYLMKNPSIHRKESKGHYTKKNCVFMEMREHAQIHHPKRK